MGFINSTVAKFDLDQARKRHFVAHCPHTSIVTSLLSAEAELSRSSFVLLAGLISLSGCASTDATSTIVDQVRYELVAQSTTTSPSPLDTDHAVGVLDHGPRGSIVGDFAAAIAERTRCGQRPDRCAIESITATGSEYRTFLTRLMAERVVAGFRTLPGRGQFRYRIESIETTDSGSAVVHTCSLDSVVLFDLGHSHGAAEFTTDPIVVDDAVVSARTRWELTYEGDRWKWTSARGTKLNMEEDICGFPTD